MYQLAVLFLFIATTNAGICDYCKYCDYCGYCVDCPCENDGRKTQCDLCVYCKFCSVCGACDTLCSDDSWVQKMYSSFFGEPSVPSSGVPTAQEVEEMLAARNVNLDNIPKKRDTPKRDL
eukprot:TRINITY_DN903_c0_g1_i4.p2 TRINITY_DN903_c0_g1~~TRINITY_DN903_c0_g1_i4.p2  ORF type:complete len:120 (+),score=15.24 TRINITY_DN903_c0_g1_i4:155-514(+)